jgi:hypothetical protein
MSKTYNGSCHCGAIRFQADIDLSQGTARCNCSICFKSRAWMSFIPANAFRLLSGEQSLRDYQFGGKSVHHVFCSQCGVRPFARSNDPQGNEFYAIRVNCLDGVDPGELIEAPVKYFNMRHDDFTSPPSETRHL